MNTQAIIPTTRVLSALVALLALLLLAPAAAADAYFVFGQIFAIPAEDADDETLAGADLGGPTLPYHQVRVYDRDTSALLGQTDAGNNGAFTVTFTLPAGSSPDVEARVYRVVDGSATLLPPAREEINHFDSIDRFEGVALRVLADDVPEYGTAGITTYPGVGLLFTRVGKVEIPFIDQNPAAPLAGMADFSSDPARPGQLGLPDFRRAPFDGRLLIFGDFGLPGGACSLPADPSYAPQIDWYRITLTPLTTGMPLTVLDPLSKTRTAVTTVPTVTVTNTTEKIGPFEGDLDDPATPVVESTPIEGLYFVNRNQVGGPTSVFYSFPDLRVNWVTGAADGLYELAATYYQQVGTAADGQPIVRQIPASCFSASPPPAVAPDVALDDLLVRVSDGKLQASFDGLFLKHRTTGRYYAGAGDPDVTGVAAAFDFTGDGLCDILELDGRYDVELHFTAHHTGGFLRNYSAVANSNDGTVNVSFASESFTTHTTDAAPAWSGTAAGGTAVVRGGFTDPCAYDVDLSAVSRLQNGYNYVQRRHLDLAYYVMP